MRKLLALAVGAALILTLNESGFSREQKGVPVVKVPLSDWTSVALQKGWFQEEFAKHGSKVEAVNLAALNIAGVEAALLDRGELHFAFRMQYPSLQHKLNGLDAVVVWQSEDAPLRRNTLFVLEDSPINSAKDLKSKKLASNRISCPYFSAFEILKVKGVPLDTEYEKGDVRYVNTSKGREALLAGRVDFLTSHPATTSTAPLYTQGLVKEIEASIPDGAYVRGGGRTSIFAMKGFAKEHPDLVRSFLVVREKTRKWIVENPDAASVIIARELRIPKHVAKFIIVDSSSYSFVPGEQSWENAVGAIKLFQNWAIQNRDDFYTKKHLSDKEIEDFVDKRFFRGGEYSFDLLTAY